MRAPLLGMLSLVSACATAPADQYAFATPQLVAMAPPPHAVGPAPPPPPRMLTARCGDSWYSYSDHRSGTCAGHGGTAEWVNPPEQ